MQLQSHTQTQINFIIRGIKIDETLKIDYKKHTAFTYLRNFDCINCNNNMLLVVVGNKLMIFCHYCDNIYRMHKIPNPVMDQIFNREYLNYPKFRP